MGLGQSFLGEKFVWVGGGLKVTLVLALVQTRAQTRERGPPSALAEILLFLIGSNFK